MQGISNFEFLPLGWLERAEPMTSGHMKNKSRRSLALALLTILGGCGAEESSPGVAMTIGEHGDSANSVVLDWLFCDDCSDGELARVRDLGDLAVPAIEEALAAADDALGRDNLSDVETFQIGELEIRLRERYRARTVELPEGADRLSEDEYVDLALRNLLRRFTARSKRALEEIDTPSAREVLGRY